MWRKLFSLCLLPILSACAIYGAGLVPGQSDRAAVTAQLGAPAMTWRNEDGSEQLAYPLGPAGYQTFMVRLGADGRLRSIDKALVPEVFAQIKPGLNQDQVLRLIGPPQPQWTAYFKARDELVWEWRYCDEWNELARFDVLFDGTTRLVRSTMARPEYLIGGLNGFGEGDGAKCSH